MGTSQAASGLSDMKHRIEVLQLDPGIGSRKAPIYLDNFGIAVVLPSIRDITESCGWRVKEGGVSFG
jgi:hypothetical protein